jgi:hypothetical protein
MRLLTATICCWVPRSEILRVEHPYLFLANLRAVFAGYFRYGSDTRPSGVRFHCADSVSYALERLKLTPGQGSHSQQQPAVTEARNLCLPIGPVRIAHRTFDDLEIELGRAKDQIKITKRIEFAEVAACCGNALIIASPERLGSAQRIGQTLVQ